VPLARLLPPTAGGVVEDVAGAGGWVGVGWAGCVRPDAYLQSCIHDVSWRGQTKTEAWLRPACTVCHARQHLLLGVQGALGGNRRQGGGCEGWMVACGGGCWYVAHPRSPGEMLEQHRVSPGITKFWSCCLGRKRITTVERKASSILAFVHCCRLGPPRSSCCVTA
jgi:hypothetical protein